MATYAAYRHIELDNVGYGKKRVLKPPGGGTSDIFSQGGPEPPVRRQRNVPKSTLFLNDDSAPGPKSPAKSSGNSSHSRLFGPPPVQPSTPSKNRMKSSIHFGGPQLAPVTNGNSHKSSSDSIGGSSDDLSSPRRSGTPCSAQRRNPLTGEGLKFRDPVPRCRRRPDGNPVTGEGYEEKPMVNGGATTNGGGPTMNGGHTNGTTNGHDHAAPLTNGACNGTNGTNGKARSRIPPGGYSKGFW